MFEVMPQLLPRVQSCRLKALGISTAERSPALPSPRTLAEQGLPGLRSSTRFGMVAAAGALQQPDVAKRLVDLRSTWNPDSPADIRAFLRADLDKWREVVAKSGAKFD